MQMGCKVFPLLKRQHNILVFCKRKRKNPSPLPQLCMLDVAPDAWHFPCACTWAAIKANSGSTLEGMGSRF